MRISPALYRRVCVVALWALCGIVVTGATVRLTGSGLGCRDWPKCEPGSVVAPWEFNAQVEFINRLITGLVSVAVIVAVGGSLLRRPRRQDLTRWSMALVAGVVAQIIIGAFVTKSDLQYSVVAVHFGVSMVLVWAAVVLVDRAGRPDGTPPRTARPGWANAIFVAAVAVLCTGPIVTSTGPHAGSEDVRRLPLDLGAVTRVHSLTVWVLCALVGWVAWMHRAAPRGQLRTHVVELLAAVVIQGGIGYLQYFTGVPAVLVAAHVAGATVVWVLTVRLVLASSTEPSLDPVDDPAAGALAR